MTSSQIKVYQTTEVHEETPLYFQITVMSSSVLVWVGSSKPESHQASSSEVTGRLGGLSMAIPTKYDKTATSTQLIPTASDTCERLAKRLASKHNMQFFVSMDIPSNDEGLVRVVEGRTAGLIKEALGMDAEVVAR
ncbi:hypothetical protein BC832DRAFT_345892 [Gaertneriomyces semiglobifer]|nr:hypothetical protein BC832DRAFT_345892 [Gaertneriomyces semiglobifer]